MVHNHTFLASFRSSLHSLLFIHAMNSQTSRSLVSADKTCLYKRRRVGGRQALITSQFMMLEKHKNKICLRLLSYFSSSASVFFSFSSHLVLVLFSNPRLEWNQRLGSILQPPSSFKLFFSLPFSASLSCLLLVLGIVLWLFIFRAIEPRMTRMMVSSL